MLTGPAEDYGYLGKMCISIFTYPLLKKNWSLIPNYISGRAIFMSSTHSNHLIQIYVFIDKYLLIHKFDTMNKIF